MLQSKVWVPLALGVTTVGFCWNPTTAQALTFTLGGTPIAGTPGNVNNFTYNLPAPVNILVGGRPATVTSATITARGGQSSIRTGAGGSLNGVVLKLGNFNITAGSLGTIDPNPSQNAFNTFLTFSNTFTVTIANSANVVISQLLNGSFPNNFTGATNQVIFPGLTVTLGAGSPITPPNLAVGALTNSRALFQIPSSTSFKNGPQVSQLTISAQLSDLVLAPGQTLNLPSSACTVIAEETEHFKLTQDDVARACQDEVEAPVTVPESSSVAGLLAVGAVAAATWMRRKIKVWHPIA